MGLLLERLLLLLLLLLLRGPLAPALISASEGAEQGTGSSPNLSAFSGIPGNCAADCAERRTPRRTTYEATLRRFGSGRGRSGRNIRLRHLGIRRIEPGLLNRPSVTFETILGELLLALPLARIYEQTLCPCNIRHRRERHDHRRHAQDNGQPRQAAT